MTMNIVITAINNKIILMLPQDRLFNGQIKISKSLLLTKILTQMRENWHKNFKTQIKIKEEIIPLKNKRNQFIKILIRKSK